MGKGLFLPSNLMECNANIHICSKMAWTWSIYHIETIYVCYKKKTLCLHFTTFLAQKATSNLHINIPIICIIFIIFSERNAGAETVRQTSPGSWRSAAEPYRPPQSEKTSDATIATMMMTMVSILNSVHDSSDLLTKFKLNNRKIHSLNALAGGNQQ